MVACHRYQWRYRLYAAAFAALALSASSAFGQASGFPLEKLPPGSELTLPQPATTYVPIGVRVSITSTDSPQTLSIVPVNIQGTHVPDVRVSIFDAHQERVRYVDLKFGSPFLYNFKKLSSISLVVDPAVAATLPAGMRIMLKSDKPLTLRHGESEPIAKR